VTSPSYRSGRPAPTEGGDRLRSRRLRVLLGDPPAATVADVIALQVDIGQHLVPGHGFLCRAVGITWMNSSSAWSTTATISSLPGHPLIVLCTIFGD